MQVNNAEVGAVALEFERSAREFQPNLLRCKNIVKIANFNVRTLNTINNLPELMASSAVLNIDAICL